MTYTQDSNWRRKTIRNWQQWNIIIIVVMWVMATGSAIGIQVLVINIALGIATVTDPWSMAQQIMK